MHNREALNQREEDIFGKGRVRFSCPERCIRCSQVSLQDHIVMSQCHCARKREPLAFSKILVILVILVILLDQDDQD